MRRAVLIHASLIEISSSLSDLFSSINKLAAFHSSCADPCSMADSTQLFHRQRRSCGGRACIGGLLRMCLLQRWLMRVRLRLRVLRHGSMRRGGLFLFFYLIVVFCSHSSRNHLMFGQHLHPHHRIGRGVITSKDKFFGIVENPHTELMIGGVFFQINFLNDLEGNALQRLKLFSSSQRVEDFSLNPERSLLTRISAFDETGQHFFPHISHFGASVLFNPTIRDERRVLIGWSLKRTSVGVDGRIHRSGCCPAVCCSRIDSAID